MKQLTCEMCGSNDLVKQDGVFVCQSCGCKYSVEEAKKMMVEGTVEVTGTVKVDGINDADKLYENAKCFKDLGETEKAKKLFEELINLYPNDYRGWWGMLELGTNNFSEIRFLRGFDFIKYYNFSIKCCREDSIKCNLTKIYETWYSKRRDYLLNERFCNSNIPDGMFANTFNKNEPFYADGIENAQKCNNKVGVFNALGFKEDAKGGKDRNAYGEVFTYSFNKFVFINGYTAGIEYKGVNTPKQFFVQWVSFSNNVNHNLDKYINMLPDGEAKDEFKGGCYVATCVYGSYDCPQVWTLRRYRDYKLDATWYGRLFIKTYYAISPMLVKWFGNTNWFKKLWKGTLDNMVAKLQEQGYEDTQYEDRK